MAHNEDPRPQQAVAESKEYDPRSDDSMKPLQPRPTTASSRHHGFRAALGLHHQAPLDREHDEGAHQMNYWPRTRLVFREPLAEFWGTFIMVMFGNGSVAQVLLSAGIQTAPGGNGQCVSLLKISNTNDN